MDVRTKLKKARKNYGLSQDDLALKLFLSRQTISNWETNKTLPDIKSLINISYIFNVSLDNLLKEDLEEMKKMVDKGFVKRFNKLSILFFCELVLLAVTAYPLFMEGVLGFSTWFILFLVTLYTSSKAEN
ncbi:helix-turn-helix transcriptional regulator [[Clostridium] innocuum]|uniref:helix-turn-helix transcriptional regulator n=1 Tax=Clostridium innocuum TaxID=1522 RepID=UPI001E422977|nr:helix-turn-helix transcriptional regulator [[Clostridium] innocuum]